MPPAEGGAPPVERRGGGVPPAKGGGLPPLRCGSGDEARRAGGVPRADPPPMRKLLVPRGSVRFQLEAVRRMEFVISTGGFKNLRHSFQNAECMQWRQWPRAGEVRDAMQEVVSLCTRIVRCYSQRRQCTKSWFAPLVFGIV